MLTTDILKSKEKLKMGGKHYKIFYKNVPDENR